MRYIFVFLQLQSDDEELPAEEEAEVLRLQKEKAESLSMADFGLEDDSEDESGAEPTFEVRLLYFDGFQCCLYPIFES